MCIEKRLELIESKQQWLFENTELSRMLYEYNITLEQDKRINDLLQDYRNKIDNGEKITSPEYESEILKIVNEDKPTADYHFAESYLELCFKEQRWEDVFEELYRDSIKFLHYFKK